MSFQAPGPDNDLSDDLDHSALWPPYFFKSGIQMVQYSNGPVFKW